MEQIGCRRRPPDEDRLLAFIDRGKDVAHFTASRKDFDVAESQWRTAGSFDQV